MPPKLKLVNKKPVDELDEKDAFVVSLNKLAEAVSQPRALTLTEDIAKQIKGEKGDKGDKGDQGEKGDSVTGPQGPKGEKGDVGKTGPAGLDGRDGLPGAEGKQGDPGQDGKDGSPETPLQIAKKLNTLEAKVDIRVIKGLLARIEGLERSLQDVRRVKKGGGGGGGMGNAVHEQFDGDGSTTAFTLANNVAAGGNAVMACRYEGQVQYLGDQFTISGKTLTFTFTPENGTKIEITYIRS